MVDYAELAQDLQKAKAKSDTNKILDLLEDLESVEMTKAILKQSKIGHAVNKLRKYRDATVGEKAKVLIAKWKRAVKVSPKSKPDQTDEKTSPPKAARGPSTPNSAGPANPDDVEIWDIEQNLTTTKSRNVVRRKIAKALEHSPVQHNYVKIAVEIETKLWFNHGQDLKRYSQQYRDICFNLRDKKNVDFKARVLNGAVKPDDIVHMQSVEMASEAQSKARKEAKEWQKAAINLDALMKASQKITNDYKCGKCGNTRNSYYQMQTRGADEPMTTFVTCLKCNKRWKD